MTEQLIDRQIMKLRARAMVQAEISVAENNKHKEFWSGRTNEVTLNMFNDECRWCGTVTYTRDESGKIKSTVDLAEGYLNI